MNRIFIFLLMMPLFAFSQKWEYKYDGNSFDGYKRIAFINALDNNEQAITLGLVNSSDRLNLINGINQKNNNGIDQLSLRLIFQNEFQPEKLLLAFDQDKKYYVINFSYNENSIWIHHA